MAVTGRLAVLVLLGGVAVVLDPTRRTVLLWVLVALVAVLTVVTRSRVGS